MTSRFKAWRSWVAPLCLLAFPPLSALACSSCGCTLNSDWSTQGLHAGDGWTGDVRYDYFVQDQLRTGTHTVDRGSIGFPADDEIQQKTFNRNLTLTLDRGLGEDWGVTLMLPYYQRSHTTIAEGDTEVSSSRSSSLGDVRLLGRYSGWSEDHSWGLQFGLKLPTGPTDVLFSGGPQAGAPLDAGLQPGTGSTDLLLGAYTFGMVTHELDYFSQVLLQLPLSSKDGFRPGAGLNATAGVRYAGDSRLVPHLQINARFERPESGDNADVPNSGASLVYLSPGATMHLGERLQVFGFVQVPIYQRVNGLQLEPRSSVSVGLHYAY